MPVRINLLPIRVVKRRLRKITAVAASLFSGGIVVIAGVDLLRRTVTLNILNKKIAQTSAQIEILRPKVAELERLKAEIAEMEERRSLIQSLQRGRFVWVKFLDTFVSLIPAGVWLESLSPTQIGHWSFSIEIHAKAFDNFKIANFMVNLMAQPQFLNVELKDITTADVHGKKVKGFGLSWHFSPTL